MDLYSPSYSNRQQRMNFVEESDEELSFSKHMDDIDIASDSASDRDEQHKSYETDDKISETVSENSQSSLGEKNSPSCDNDNDNNFKYPTTIPNDGINNINQTRRANSRYNLTSRPKRKVMTDFVLGDHEDGH